MRIISQDGASDVPYERYSVCAIKDEHRNIYHIVCDYSEKTHRRLAEYSTKAKATKAMEMLREAYETNKFYHHMSTTDVFKDVVDLLGNEEFNRLTSEYFQFPQDDEIEV